jgi:hypothetical protein
MSNDAVRPRMLRRTILFIAATVILAMLICPPWLHASGSAGDFSHGEFQAGYHLLFRPPYEKSRINVQLLLLQIGAVGLVTWFVSAALKKSTG